MNKTGKKIITVGKVILITVMSVILAASLMLTGCFFDDDYPDDDYPNNDPSSDETDAPKPARNFTVQNVNGESVELSDFSGEPIVVNFWARWCSPCMAELPHFDEMYNVYGDEVKFIMINVDGDGSAPEEIQQSMTDAGFSFPVYFDMTGSAASAYRVSSIPISFFINSEGYIVSSHLGSMNENQLMNEISKILPQE